MFSKVHISGFEKVIFGNFLLKSKNSFLLNSIKLLISISLSSLKIYAKVIWKVYLWGFSNLIFNVQYTTIENA